VKIITTHHTTLKRERDISNKVTPPGIGNGTIASGKGTITGHLLQHSTQSSYQVALLYGEWVKAGINNDKRHTARGARSRHDTMVTNGTRSPYGKLGLATEEVRLKSCVFP
jgi:adenylylsulfate kinase-like enzyme